MEVGGLVAEDGVVDLYRPEGPLEGLRCPTDVLQEGRPDGRGEVEELRSMLPEDDKAIAGKGLIIVEDKARDPELRNRMIRRQLQGPAALVARPDHG